LKDAAIIQKTEIAASSKEIDSRLCCKFDLLLMVSSRESSVEPRIPAFVHAKQTSPLSIVFQRGSVEPWANDVGKAEMAKSSVGEWMSWMMWMIELHVDLGLLSDDRIFLAPVPFMPWT
jgi:hypothetical protein